MWYSDIDSGKEDCHQERELHDKEQLHAQELHVKKRINEVNNTIYSYQMQLALTEKMVFQELITKKKEEMSKLQDKLKAIEGKQRQIEKA